jgi:hypothetical protein
VWVVNPFFKREEATMIDVKKLLYKYHKLQVGLANIRESMSRLNKQYPGCTPGYNDDIKGRGGLPMSQTERFGIFNLEVHERTQMLEWDAEEHLYAISLVRTALETLSAREQELIKLSYFESREPVSVANNMNISLSRYYHLHLTAMSGIEQCFNEGNIFTNRLIPTKNNKKRNKNTRIYAHTG